MNANFTRTTATEWVCTDCHLAIAGYSSDETGHDMPTPFADITGVEDVANGSPIAECDTPECVAAVAALLSAPSDPERFAPFDRAQELHDECDHDSFSLHPCAGCGSSLAGDRYAVTVSYVEWEESAPCAREGQGHCSADRVTVYHGAVDPTAYCGKHANI